MREHRAPAFRSACLLSCGILVAPALPLISPHLSLAAAGVLAALTLLSLLHHSALPASLLAAGLISTVGLGIYRAQADGAPAIPAELAGARSVAEIRLLEDPRPAGRSIRFLAEITRTAREGRIIPFRGTAIVRWSPARGDTASPQLQEGDRALLIGTLYGTGGPRNPGEFDVGGWLRANGIDAEFTARGLRAIIADSVRLPLPPIRGIARALRRGILAGIEKDVGGEEGAFLKGLLIGERSGIDPGTAEAFARAGVTHVLAVSGSNVAVVLLFLGLLSSPLRGFPAVRSLLLSAGAILYMLMTGAQPPVVRATLMAGVGLAAHLFQERINGLNLLGLAATLMLGVDPRILFDVGFQLSFLAVLSLIIGAPRTEALLRPLAMKGPIGRVLRSLLRVAAVSLAATLGTLPLTAGCFGRVSLIGVAANIVVVPATGVSVLLGSIGALLSPFWEWGASVYGAANWGILRFTLWFTRWAAHPSFASLSTEWFSGLHGAVYFSFLFALGTITTRRFRIAAPLFLGILALFPWLPEDQRFHPPPGHTRVTVLDVGQGDAIFVERDGRRLLIDAGPSLFGSDAGRRVIVPYLDRTGGRRIDALIITHGHLDHTGGLPGLLAEAVVCSMYAPPGVAQRLASQTGRRVSPLASGGVVSIGGETRCYVLAPERGWRGRDSTGNEASIAVKLQAGATAWLLAGDATVESEERMVRRYGPFLRSDVLKAGHHGSSTSSGEAFLRAVRPRQVIISVGKNNRFQHPSESVVRRCADAGGAVHRTDVEGGVITESDGETVRVIRWIR